MRLKPARFLDPKSDVVFQKIFGQHPDLIKSFLNSILPLENGQLIDHLEYLSSEQAPRIPTLKKTIVDVKCTDQQGRIFIVEMQMQWIESFSKRLLFGASKAYVQQLNKGEDYKSLCPVYGLGIVNDIFDKQSEDWFHHYRSVNVQRPDRVLEGLELIFIELPKFKPQTWKEKKLGVLWLRFLKEIDEKTQDVDEDFANQPDLSKALELSQESAYSKAELEAYDQYWDAVSVERSFEQEYLRRVQDALAEGEAREARGEARGKAEGKEEGKAEEQRKSQAALATIAQNMLNAGWHIPDIANMMGLTEEDVQQLLSPETHSVK